MNLQLFDILVGDPSICLTRARMVLPWETTRTLLPFFRSAAIWPCQRAERRSCTSFSDSDEGQGNDGKSFAPSSHLLSAITVLSASSRLRPSKSP